ncbi:cyclin N-terminal domain-containing protein 1 [Erpetoichthys calabaricus]|nr:cyclin N-terminal domain-containing protein 1 [Erpetoichthys calabaricus]
MTAEMTDMPKFGSTPRELLADLLQKLKTESEAANERVSEHAGSFKRRRLVEFVFLICEELKLEPFIKFQTIEIFERYMIRHVESLFYNASAHYAPETQDIQEFLGQKLFEEINLLLFSCIQITSKLSLRCNFDKTDTALTVLRSLGFSYKKETILESELRILKTLNFSLNVQNPLMYIETLLEVWGYNDSAVPIIDVYKTCLAVLQFVYLQRNPIYQKLLVAAVGNSNPTEVQRVKFLSVKEDCMLLAVSVISVSAFIVNFTSWTQILEELSSITGITADNISDISCFILKHILEN